MKVKLLKTHRKNVGINISEVRKFYACRIGYISGIGNSIYNIPIQYIEFNILILKRRM